MNNGDVMVLPRFIGEEGKRFLTVRFLSMKPPNAHIVFIPPFGEEMNRCRSLVATQARNFARAGYSCTLVDFYGTGDSQGELRDASLTLWESNVRAVVEELQTEFPAPVVLWGLRLGGLLALNFCVNPHLRPRDIILWQPVNSGTAYITQVLRQRVASLMLRDLPPETTKEIRQRLASGEDVEISGYTLRETLVGEIESIDVSHMSGLCTGTIYWLEHVAEAGKEIGLAARKLVDQLSLQDNKVELRTFSDPPIWQIHERDFAPQLLAITDGLLA
jgi:exosortase A-associated hydrolase 2